jgi:hypothetical protein
VDEELKPPAKENLVSEAPSALPPATGALAGAKSPLLWIVAAVVGVLAVGGVLLGCLICAGVMFFISPTNVSPEIEYVDSKGGMMPYDSYGSPVETMPVDAWSEPAYSSGYSTEATIAPEAATPADAVDGQPSAESIYSEQGQSYDPDWQLELPQYQQDAIQDLNNQREQFGTP